MTMRWTTATRWSILIQLVLSLVVKVNSVSQAAEASPSQADFEIPRGKRILPYSLYLQKIEERRQSQQTGVSSPDANRPPIDLFLPSAVVGQQPVSIYLPAFANATAEHIASRYGGERQKDELGATNDDSPGEKLFSTKGASSPSSPYINAFSVRPRASSSISAAGRASSNPIRPQSNRNYVVTTTPLSSSPGQPPQPSGGAGISSQIPGNPFAAPIPPTYGKGQPSLNSVDNELVKSFGEIGDGRKKLPLGGQTWESAEGRKADYGPTNPYYSTSANREPLQFERTSMFRPAKSGGGGDHGKQYPWTYSATSAENSLITRPTSMFQSMRSTNNAKSIPSTMQYSKLSPAPGHTLSMSASDRNIVDSIFSQSQSKRYPNPPNSEMRSQVRYAPLPSPIHPVNGPPLSGSPFDLFGGAAHPLTPFGGAASGIGGAQGGAGGVPLFNPLELLGQGSTIEQISKIAKNLLAMGSGNPELFSAVTKAIGGGGGAGAADPSSKLTSTATNSVIQPESAAASLIKAATSLASGKNPLLSLPKIDSAGDAAAINETTAALNGTTVDVQALLASTENSTLVADPKKLLAVLPQEQRSLLEAAIRNGELDGGKLDPTLLGTTSPPVSAGVTAITATSTFPTPTTRNGGVINSENRLMEWIQQNRPRPSEKSDAPTMLLAADKLPYYGRYCGSFVEKLDAQNRRRFNIAGALWAVDDRRLIVSNFHFQPGSRYENITFLGGPANFTRTVTDFFPSANGFYLRPEPIAMQAFLLQQSERVASRLRSPTAADREKKTAEEEELEGENSTLASPLSRNELGSKRMKRNLYDELYENSKRGVTPIMMPGHFTTTSLRAGPVSALEPNRFPQFTTQTGAPMDIGSTTLHTPSPTLLDNLGTVGAAAPPASLTPTATPASLRIITGGTSASIFPVVSTAAALPPSTPPPTAVLDGGPTQRAPPNNESGIVPLEWAAGFQPLLLTLPEGRLVRNLRWVALWDHNRRESVAFVLIPNGAAFQIPSMVQLRAVTANGAYQVSSGPIRVLDTKTIEINEFSLITNGLPTWFMAGKEIMPNANGHIVPVFNRANSSFDCDALRDYKNETVTLRLPGTMDIKDVFWFSVYSIPTGVSLAHMYLPYNDMHLPPDLLPLPAPQCYWRPK